MWWRGKTSCGVSGCHRRGGLEATLGLEFVDFQEGVGDGLLRQLDEAPVMGEEEDLLGVGDGAEGLERRLGSGIVEGEEDVINDERHRLVRVHVVLERGEPKAEVELVAGAVA